MSLIVKSCWTERQQDQIQRQDDHRTPYQRDRARILHSAAFRRLQAKRQIHAVGENDFYRTRLTHSLEVAQIGSSLTNYLMREEKIQHLLEKSMASRNYALEDFRKLLPSTELIEGLCLAHDIGHPPFGHGGENALNFVMYKDGGFEGNAQTFRILTRLEPYTEHNGMDLTRRTLLGVIKYPMLIQNPVLQFPNMESEQLSPYVNMDKWEAQKGIYQDDANTFNWVLEPLTVTDRKNFLLTDKVKRNGEVYKKTKYKSLDCSIMELADDIAYAVHDLEDAIVLGMVEKEAWDREVASLIKEKKGTWISDKINTLSNDLFANEHYLRKDAIGTLVNYFICHVEWVCYECFDEPLLNYNAKLPDDVVAVLTALKKFVRKHVINHINTQRVEYKGQRILRELFQILRNNPERLLPSNTYERWKSAVDTEKNRIICDYIAGMSDNYARKLYDEL